MGSNQGYLLKSFLLYLLISLYVSNSGLDQHGDYKISTGNHIIDGPPCMYVFSSGRVGFAFAPLRLNSIQTKYRVPRIKMDLKYNRRVFILCGTLYFHYRYVSQLDKYDVQYVPQYYTSTIYVHSNHFTDVFKVFQNFLRHTTLCYQGYQGSINVYYKILLLRCSSPDFLDRTSTNKGQLISKAFFCSHLNQTPKEIIF